MNLVTEVFKRFWLEKLLSFFVSVKMIIMAASAVLVWYGKISGDNFAAIVLGVTGAYGINKVVETFRKKVPAALREDVEGD